MDVVRKVTELVENKMGKIIEDDLRERIRDESAIFDVSAYADELFAKYFTGNEIENIENEIMGNRCRGDDDYESDISAGTDNNSQESSDFDGHEFLTLSVDEVVGYLQSESSLVRTKCLKELEICAEDLINQTSWGVVRKILQNFLEFGRDRETHLLTLKIFQKFLLSPNKQQMVSDAFISLSQVICSRMEVINLIRRRSSYEEIYDLKENKWLTNKKLNTEMKPADEDWDDLEVLIKSMVLLIKCQKQMPGKWIRFHDKRLREIVFAFIQLLSSTTTSKFERLTGLELLAVLNPTGNWCRHWCHTAIGRSLLCSALKKYKTFFIHIVEIILVYTRKRKSNYLLPPIDNLCLRETSPEPFGRVHLRDKENRLGNIGSPTGFARTSNSGKKPTTYTIANIPRKVAAEAVFCHSLSLVIILIQFKSGRALFPVQTTSRKRLLSVQDLVTSMTEYLRCFERNVTDTVGEGVKITSEYRQHMFEMMEMLRNVQTRLYSSRRSADRMSDVSNR